MAEKLLCGKGWTEPPSVPTGNWMDSEVTRDEFWASTEKRETQAQKPEGGKFFLPHGDDKDGQGLMDLMDAEKITRFRVERGEYPMSKIIFCAKSKATNGWAEWCSAILKVTDYNSTLRMAGVLDAIEVASMLDVNRCNEALTLLLSRWSSSTHTFIAAWGEFTPTLEDVITLLRLKVLARDNIMDIKLSKEEMVVYKFLKASITASGKNTPKFSTRGNASKGKRANFYAWIRYFHQEVSPSSEDKEGEVVPGPEAESPYVLEAFIALWLSKFIFPGPPNEGINACVFPLAIKIAKGKCFSLATVYLGTLYRRLDMVEEAIRRSMGRYAHACYADTGFLQMFLWERFPSYAPQRKEYENEQLVPRAWCWSGVYPLKNFRAHLDIESHFNFRPYSIVPIGVHPVKIFLDTGRQISLKHRKQILDDDFTALIMLFPYTFIALVHQGKDSDNTFPVLYSPERVARQFGLDQGAATIQYTCLHTADASQYLISRQHYDIHTAVEEILLPSSTRQGVVTQDWLWCWRNVLKTFDEFIQEKVPAAPVLCIYKSDPLLQNLTQPQRPPPKATTPTRPPPKIAAPEGEGVASSNVPQRRPSKGATSQDVTVEEDLLVSRVTRKRKAPPTKTAHKRVIASPSQEALEEVEQESELIGTHILSVPQDSLDDLGLPFKHTNNEDAVEDLARQWSETSFQNPRQGKVFSNDQRPLSDIPSEEFLHGEDSGNWEAEGSGSESREHEDTHNLQDPFGSVQSHTDEGDEPSFGSPFRYPSPIGFRQYIPSPAFAFEPGEPLGEPLHRVHIPTPLRSPILVLSPPLVGVTPYPMTPDTHNKVMWKGTLVHADMIPTLERVYNKFGDLIGSASMSSAHFKTLTAESLARCVDLCECQSARNLSPSEREYIHNSIKDMELMGVNIGWLREPFERAKTLADLSDALVLAETLRDEVARARANLGALEGNLAKVEASIEEKRGHLGGVVGSGGNSPILTDLM